MAYAKCQCGTESREIVPIDKTGYTQLPNGNWRFNPNAPKAEPTVQKVKCTECGKFNDTAPDPASVRSFLKFNFMEM